MLRITMVVLVLVSGFISAEETSEAVELRLQHPLHEMEVIQVQGSGAVASVSGIVRHAKFLESKQYIDLEVGNIVANNTMIEIYPGAKVSVQFGSRYFVYESGAESRYVMFKLE